jgi:glycerol-3-phosphate acyltransferase PlsX
MKIAVDGMGGDYAPQEIVKGSVDAAKQFGVGILLVGPQDKLQQELTKHDLTNAEIEIVHTDEYLIEGEEPAFTLRKKRNASVALAAKLVRDGKADAMISAGPTGGVVASALQILGTVGELSRPVIGGPFLGFAPNTIMIDLGGNVDCKPEQFVDFAIVGTVYAKKMLNIENPTVALLSIGAEEGKGNEQVKLSYELFKKSGLNFIGNIEGYDIPSGKANVVICDGFTGNVLVKFCEALGKTICQWMEDNLKGKLAEEEIKAMTGQLLRATNAADARGGGPLWAINGIACVAHGRAKAIEISRVIEQVKENVEKDWLSALKEELAAAHARLNIDD